MAADGRDQVSGIQGVPAARKPGGLPAGVVFGERRPVNAEQARQDCRPFSSNRERASRQAARCRFGPLRHGWEEGSVLAESQAGYEKTSQSLRNHRPLVEQTYLRLSFRRFENSRNVEVTSGTRTNLFWIKPH